MTRIEPDKNPAAAENAVLFMRLALESLKEFVDHTATGTCDCNKQGKTETYRDRDCHHCEVEECMEDAEGAIFNLQFLGAMIDTNLYSLSDNAERLCDHLKNNRADWPEPNVLAGTLARLAGMEEPEEEADAPAVVLASVD